MRYWLFSALTAIMSIIPVTKTVHADPPKQEKSIEERVKEIERVDSKISRGSKVSTFYQIHDKTGIPLKNQTIEVQYNGRSYNLKTDENGIFTVSLNARKASEEIRIIDTEHGIDERKKIELSDIVDKEITKSMRFIQRSEKTAGLLKLYLSGNTEYNCEISIKGDYISVILSNIKGKSGGVKLEALKLKAHEGVEIKKFTHQHYGFKLSDLTQKEKEQFSQFIANSPFSQSVSLEEGWLKNKEDIIKKNIENSDFPLKDRFYFTSEGESIEGIQEGNLPSTNLNLKQSGSVSSYDITYEKNITGIGIIISGETSVNLKDTAQVKIKGEHLKIKDHDWGFKLTYEVAIGDKIETTDYFINAQILADIFDKEDDIYRRLEKVEKTIKENKKRIFFEKRKTQIKEIDKNNKDTNINAILGMFSKEHELALVYGEEQIIKRGFVIDGKEYIQELQEESPFSFSPKILENILTESTMDISLLKVINYKNSEKVFIDGKYVGDTPITIELSKGKHKIKVKDKEEEIIIEGHLKNIFFYDELERKMFIIEDEYEASEKYIYFFDGNNIKQIEKPTKGKITTIKVSDTKKLIGLENKLYDIEKNSVISELPYDIFSFSSDDSYAILIKKSVKSEMRNMTMTEIGHSEVFVYFFDTQKLIALADIEDDKYDQKGINKTYYDRVNFKKSPNDKYLLIDTIQTGSHIGLNNNYFVERSQSRLQFKRITRTEEKLEDIMEKDEIRLLIDKEKNETQVAWTPNSEIVYFTKEGDRYGLVVFNPETRKRTKTIYDTVKSLVEEYHSKGIQKRKDLSDKTSPDGIYTIGNDWEGTIQKVIIKKTNEFGKKPILSINVHESTKYTECVHWLNNEEVIVYDLNDVRIYRLGLDFPVKRIKLQSPINPWNVKFTPID